MTNQRLMAEKDTSSHDWIDDLPLPQDKKQEVKEYMVYSEKSLKSQSSMRGMYLLVTSQLEGHIDSIIAHHLCKSETHHNQLCSLILKYVPFFRKIQVLKKIMENYDPDIKTLYSTIPNLGELAKLRNNLAHATPYVPYEKRNMPFDESIELKIYNNDKQETSTIPKTEFEKRVNQASTAASLLLIINMIIAERNSRQLVP